MVEVARQVAQRLKDEKNITATVINARFVKPLDEALILQYGRNSQLLVTLEEHSLAGGFGSAVLELLNREQVNSSNVLRIGIGDEFVPHGNTELLKQLAGLDVQSITEKISSRLEELQV